MDDVKYIITLSLTRSAEVSMLGLLELSYINKRLQELKNDHHSPFGGWRCQHDFCW